MVQLKVLISGAGIGGNALAFWLSKLGHEVVIVERFPGLRTTGLQIDLRGEGIEALQRMGLEAAFRAHAAPEQGVEVVDGKGKRWGYFPANKTPGGMQSFTSDYEIMRGKLCQIMYDDMKDRVTYMFGTSVESFEEKNGALQVLFTNGITDTFDLLVGADGQGSKTRKLMLGPGVPDVLKPAGECVAYFTVPRPIQPGEEYIATGYIATGGRAVCTRRDNPHNLQVYLMGGPVTKRLESVRKGDIEEEKRAFTEVYQGAGWEVDANLELLNKSDNFYCERQGVVRLPSWSKGRVTLLGDAAHCTPANGTGTSNAMIGAYILAGEIARHCGRADDKSEEKKTPDNIETALKAYEDKFRPYIEGIQKGIGEPSIMDGFQWTPFRLRIMYWAVWFASLVRLDLLIGVFMIYQTKGWKMPDYEELRID